MNRPNILIACTGNSARSQMTEALFRHRGGNRFLVHSAGIAPKTIHPITWTVLEEIGVDASGLWSKSITEFPDDFPFARVFVVCQDAANEFRQLLPNVRSWLLWPFEDPAAAEGEVARLAAFRNVRDQIDAKIQEWLASNPSDSEL